MEQQKKEHYLHLGEIPRCGDKISIEGMYGYDGTSNVLTVNSIYWDGFTCVHIDECNVMNLNISFFETGDSLRTKQKLPWVYA